MIASAASLVAEILMPLFAGLAELTLIVLVASVRPWRYIVSPTYRGRIDLELSKRGVIARSWYMFWGTVVVLLSLGIIWAVASVASQQNHNSKPERLVQAATAVQVGKAIVDKVRDRQGEKQ
jgi:hypothetical protein